MLHNLFVTIIKYKQPYTIDNIPKNTDSLIIKSLEYINANLLKDPSCTDVAKYVNLSYSHFAKRFKNALGVNYSYYITRLKIQYAQILLSNTDDSIDEISNSLNFCNSNYFANIFKKYTRKTPTEYRKLKKSFK